MMAFDGNSAKQLTASYEVFLSTSAMCFLMQRLCVVADSMHSRPLQ
jgi:hypothetical protein